MISYSLQIEPADHFVNWQQDPFANWQARLVFPEPVTMFKVTVDLVVEMAVYNPFDFFLEPYAEKFPFSYDTALAQELAPYLVVEPMTPLVADYLQKVDQKPQRTIDFLVGINQQVAGDIKYLIRLEPGIQSPEQTLQLASGSCRDSGWLLVQLLRRLGLAARFVSGYLIQLVPDVKALDGPSGTTVDFTDLHAWCEVYLPGAGWVGLDATSGLLAGEGHIPLACTPTPSGAAPIEGVVDDAEVEFGHEMSVSRLFESPRVTKPYTEEQWADVLALGAKVDAELDTNDVRLTMGGEPTFVCTTDRDAAEWNTAALGPTKRGYATELVKKLRAEYGDGGFLHFGQGKWYPGEQLPRWALSICWRADGKPIWHDPELFADERVPSHYDSTDAHAFIRLLATKLGVGDDTLLPAYEDVWYYLWRERRLPVNVDPFDAKLDDELERARLRRVFSQKLDSVIGYALPLKAEPDSQGAVWSTGHWFLRDERLYLLPGDSPMGYRLPLDSLPWANESDRSYLIEEDPSAPRAPLAEPAVLAERYATAADADDASRAGQRGGVAAVGTAVATARTDTDSLQRTPKRGESAHWITRGALCVEARDPSRAHGPEIELAAGKQPSRALYVFMPPASRLEDYLELVTAVEATARELKVKIVLEGYPPPRDPRLKLLAVTPDPGVIEVNIHPANNWNELVEHTEFLYEAAFETRLSAEKFMTDGRHTGTGGGNHFVMGGATPADSPFLRRPELLTSLLTYWHNHPSLSYLFSGMFIGPTSQAPRVDEARNDQVYELEIATARDRARRKPSAAARCRRGWSTAACATCWST